MDWKREAAQLAERGRTRFALPATATEVAFAHAAPGAGTSYQPPETLPRANTFRHCDATDEDAAQIAGVEPED